MTNEYTSWDLPELLHKRRELRKTIAFIDHEAPLTKDEEVRADLLAERAELEARLEMVIEAIARRKDERQR